MKLSQLIILAGLSVCSATLAAQEIDSTLIEVSIEGMLPGKVRVVGTYSDRNYIVDSTVSEAGAFVIRRKSQLKPGFYTFLIPGNKSLSILVDKDQRFKLKAKFPDYVNTMEVDGSPNTELFYRNLKFQGKQEPELNKLSDILKKNPPESPEYKTAKDRQTQLLAERKAHLEEIYQQNPKAFFTTFKRAGQNPDLTEFRKPNGDMDTLRNLIHYRNHFWDGVDFSDDRLLNTPVIGNKLRRYITELTPQRPDSIIKVADELIRRVMPHKEYFKLFTNWIALKYENGKTTVMDGEAVYVHIVRNFFTPELAFWSNTKEIADLQKHVGEMEASLLGRKGPDVKAADIDGQMRSIYEKTAPIIVVFMYSPDCEHCQKDSPKIQQIYEKWKGKGVDFYGIAVNTTEEEYRTFHKKNGFTFTDVFDPTNRAIYAKYFVDITPELYVLDKNRTIVAKNLHAEQLEEVFERELRKQKK